jgi:hypothetical protein
LQRLALVALVALAALTALTALAALARARFSFQQGSAISSWALTGYQSGALSKSSTLEAMRTQLLFYFHEA